MKKRYTVLLVVAAFIIGMMASGVAGAGENIKVWINGKQMVSDQPPVIINDRVFVPLRAVSENMGASVGWDYETQTAYIASPGDPQDIVIVGTPEFQKTVRDALQLLKDKDPEDYRFIGQYVRRIETIDRDYSAPGIYNMTVYITNKLKPDIYRYAEITVHESQHIQQKYTFNESSTGILETEAYNRGLNALKKIGAPQSLIDDMQKWVDNKPWQN